MRLRWSTKQMSRPLNMATVWPPWMTMRCLHPTVSHLLILVPRMPLRKNQSKPKQPAWPIQQFCMNVGQQPPPNIYTPTQQQHMSNNCFGRRNSGSSGRGNGSGNFPQQPTWFGGSGAGAQQPTRPPKPPSIRRIGTTAQHMVAMLKTGTQAQRVGIGARHTILMQPVPTSWVDWSPEYTRPSYRWRVAALHPPVVAPSSSSAHSNTHQGHTTQPKARLPHPRSLEECNLPAAPTTSGRP